MRTNVNPSVNDVVIIYEDKAPRQNWRLGKMISLIPINKPINNKLYPIEFSKENDSNEIPNDKDEDFVSLNENMGSSKNVL